MAGISRLFCFEYFSPSRPGERHRRIFCEDQGRCEITSVGGYGSRRSPGRRWSSALVVTKFGDVRALPGRQQARPGVEIELGAGVGDVEIAHGQLADTVRRRERRILNLLHAQALR